MFFNHTLQLLRQQLQNLHSVWGEEIQSAERAQEQADVSLKSALQVGAQLN